MPCFFSLVLVSIPCWHAWLVMFVSRNLRHALFIMRVNSWILIMINSPCIYMSIYMCVCARMHDRVHKTCIHDAFCSCHTAKNKNGDGRRDPKQFYVLWRIEAVNLIISVSGDSRTALRFAVKDTLLDIVPHTIKPYSLKSPLARFSNLFSFGKEKFINVLIKPTN